MFQWYNKEIMSKLTRRQQRKRDRKIKEMAKRVPEFISVRPKRAKIIFNGSPRPVPASIPVSTIRYHDGSPIN